MSEMVVLNRPRDIDQARRAARRSECLTLAASTAVRVRFRRSVALTTEAGTARSHRIPAQRG